MVALDWLARHHLKQLPRNHLPRAALVQLLEVAPQGLERIPFVADLPCRSDAHAAEHRQGRTPTLHGMLEEKRRDESGQEIPAAVHETSQAQSDQRDEGGVAFERPLDIPFAIQLGQPPADGS